MSQIHIIATSELQKASLLQEALFCRVLKKIVDVEALAMRNLGERLTPKSMEILKERILILKERSSRSFHKERIITFPTALLSEENQINPEFKAEISALLRETKGEKAAKLGGDIQDQRPHAGQTVQEKAPEKASNTKSSFLAKAKSLFGFHESYDEAHDKFHRESMLQNHASNNNDRSENFSNLGGFNENYYPTLSFKLRGKTAGTAYLQRWEIRLNPILLAENSDAFINEVIPHEYAHLLTFALYGRVQPHGKEWQAMMIDIMGLPANRTHRFDTKNSETRQYERFTYYCLCQTHLLTAIRHNRIQANKATYHCKHCGETLERRE
ncbi:SprT family zinc-dependent metalloprotease [Ignatzschineria sp. LJL83]